MKQILNRATSLLVVAFLLGFPGMRIFAEQRSAAEPSIEERCRSEVIETHVFIEQWSNGELPDTDEAYARFEGVIASDFVIIDPDGDMIERQPIVDAVKGAHGRWQPPGVIRIENFRFHAASGDLAVVSYEEWHDLADGGDGRLSSAVFRRNGQAPNGVEWLHLSEVWLQAPGGS